MFPFQVCSVRFPPRPFLLSMISYVFYVFLRFSTLMWPECFLKISVCLQTCTPHGLCNSGRAKVYQPGQDCTFLTRPERQWSFYHNFRRARCPPVLDYHLVGYKKQCKGEAYVGLWHDLATLPSFSWPSKPDWSTYIEISWIRSLFFSTFFAGVDWSTFPT